MRCFCLILILLGSLTAFAQQDITGKVTDQRNLPLPGATITLRHHTEIKIRYYAIADSLGSFKLKNIKAGNYQLEVAFITYKSQERTFTVGNDPIEVQLFRLMPEPQHLAEVTIKGKKQAITVSAGKTTMNVEQSNLAQSQSAYDLLKSLPGVSINKDGDIRIKGKSGVTVMIDGEPVEIGSSQLKSLLKGTPGTTLQTMEVMTNPPSGLDASGTGGVINLVFKKKVKKGFNGTMSSTVSKGRYYNTNQSLNLTYGTGKWKLNALYAYNFEHSQNRDSMFRSQGTDYVTGLSEPGKNYYMSQMQLNPDQSKTHMMKFGLDRHFEDKNTLGVNLSFNDIRNPTDGRTVTRFGMGIVEDSLLNQRNYLRNTLRNLDYGLKFKHRFDEQKTLSASAQFNHLKSDGFEDFTIHKTLGSGISLPELRYRNTYPSKINRGIFKADYVQELMKGDQRTGKFEAGVKSSQTHISTSQFSENRVGENWQADPLRNNNFSYREVIYAAYTAMELNMKPWTFNAGLRGEYTRVKGNAGAHESLVRQNYFSLFPNVLIGYKLSEAYNLSVSFNRRIERPDYDKLNPAVRYIDLYTTKQGNPGLKPQFSNNIELNQQFFDFIDLTLGYSSIKDPIYSTLITSAGAKSVYTAMNTGQQQQWEVSLSFPIPGADWWENHQSFYIYSSQFNANLENKVYRAKANSFGALSYNSFKLPSNFSIELSAWYEGGGLFANFRYKPVSEVSAGVSKKLLNDQLTVGVAATDVFYGGNYKATVLSNTPEISNLISRTDSRQVKFSLSWNFGKKRKIEKLSEQNSEDDYLPAGKSRQIPKRAKP
ncbi:outer membrane receptor protein involved in Fe transport [Pedobacter cryoconitis]|uniref:outer membrane beta-barrel family protein n=1 Tax=Pedobacter cryoconitis TaxID=188932 RepID=UPI00160C4FA5|nr:outer membrane beta-barrel family protein [Pedobacter cryoconitis]MBB6272470.1 outer membrane receptor protein involved in Fe transport [Pedobacter cryoconitis]